MSNYIKEIRKNVGHDAVFMPCAGAIIYKNGEVLLQKREDSGKWAIHGGAMEFGETVIQTLERELIEEIGIKPLKPEFMGIYSTHHIYPNLDEVYAISNIFIVEDYEMLNQKCDNEVLETKWFDIDGLPNNIHEPDKVVFDDLKGFLKDKKIIIK